MISLKNLTFFSILFFLLIDLGISQDVAIDENKQENEVIRYPNIVKINSLAIPFNNISVAYERGIKPRLSAGIGLGYKYAGTEPAIFTVNNSVIGVGLDKINGFSVTPEVRYYLKSCDPGQLEGFYGGLYFRYTGYTTVANLIYNPVESEKEYYNADIRLDEFGVGIQLGYQLMLWERFSIDFLFFGPRFSSYHLSYEFNQPPSQEFLDDLSDHMNEIVDRFGFDYNVNIEKQGEAKANTTFSFLNTRFGISLGFAF